MSQIYKPGTGVTPPSTNDLVKYISPSIDFKVIGTTNFFVTTSAGFFIPISSIALIDNANNEQGDNVFNIGWTGPNFDDYFSGISIANVSTDTYTFLSESASPPYVPASTQIVVNVTTGDTGTALVGRIAMVGFYLT